MFRRKTEESTEPYTAVYLTYSFDMDMDEMRRNHPHAKYLGTTILCGYRLAFRGQVDHYALATIEQSVDNSVPVVLWHIPASYEAALDRDCKPLYRKISINVIFQEKSIPCIAYSIYESYQYGMPSIEYFKLLLGRYVSFKFCVRPLVQGYRESMQAHLKNEKIRLGEG